jgi:rare lipoprotein A (peptidoglycan hydrolase)
MISPGRYVCIVALLTFIVSCASTFAQQEKDAEHLHFVELQAPETQPLITLKNKPLQTPGPTLLASNNDSGDDADPTSSKKSKKKKKKSSRKDDDSEETDAPTAQEVGSPRSESDKKSSETTASPSKPANVFDEVHKGDKSDRKTDSRKGTGSAKSNSDSNDDDKTRPNDSKSKKSTSTSSAAKKHESKPKKKDLKTQSHSKTGQASKSDSVSNTTKGSSQDNTDDKADRADQKKNKVVKDKSRTKDKFRDKAGRTDLKKDKAAKDKDIAKDRPDDTADKADQKKDKVVKDKDSSKDKSDTKADKDDASTPDKADKFEPIKPDPNKPDVKPAFVSPPPAPSKPQIAGNASWYGVPFHGRKTASGEVFNMYRCSAAHRTLPLVTRVLVEDPRTGNTVMVRVNDRGPYAGKRVMDLSREAARALGTMSRGVYYIEATVVGKE